MKKFYKFTTAFLALIILLPFGTIHAAAYDDCDVNHDGFVDVSDAVATARYLAGDHYISSYNRFDTNISLTVDASDVEKILAKIVQNTYSAQYWSKNGNCGVSFPTVSGFTAEPDASSNSSRTYQRFVYSNGNKYQYTLTPSAANFNAVPSNPIPREVIGTDDRIPSTGTENTGIVILENVGTGFIVGDHVIATAAHCVYNKYENQQSYFKTALTIHPYNSNGTVNTNITFTPVEAHMPIEYGTCPMSDNYLHDYALITVSEDLSNYFHFSLGTTYNMSATVFADVPLYVLGPRMTGSQINDLYYSQGNIVSYSDTTADRLIYYNCDTKGGDSGAPVYTITKATIGNQTFYYYTVIAIHVRNDSYGIGATHLWNAGNRITKYHLQFFDESTNTNLNY